MGPRRLLHTALLLLAQATLPEASQYCSRLEYWDLDNKSCRSCLQRFGPPPSPDHEFVENCGLSDFGDLLTHQFRKCSSGWCNPGGAELCGPCGSAATAPTPAGNRARARQRSREKPIPPKGFYPPATAEARILSSPRGSSLSWATQSQVSPPGLVLALALALGLLFVLVLLLMSAVLLCPAPGRPWCKGRAASLPCPAWVCRDPNTCTPASLHSGSPGTLEALEAGHVGKVPLLPLPSRELPGLASQPLSRLLDELEVLEELIVLLDPEPGPGGSPAYGTTRHLAARYGLPAAWSTFTYSLRPSCSPLRALIEMVVAREPSASLGQLGTHLAQLGRADALRVLAKLGRAGFAGPAPQ